MSDSQETRMESIKGRMARVVVRIGNTHSRVSLLAAALLGEQDRAVLAPEASDASGHLGALEISLSRAESLLGSIQESLDDLDTSGVSADATKPLPVSGLSDHETYTSKIDRSVV